MATLFLCDLYFSSSWASCWKKWECHILQFLSKRMRFCSLISIMSILKPVLCQSNNHWWQVSLLKHDVWLPWALAVLVWGNVLYDFLHFIEFNDTKFFTFNCVISYHSWAQEATSAQFTVCGEFCMAIRVTFWLCGHKPDQMRLTDSRYEWV